MLIHELATNAAKYGALSVPKGRVRLEWSRSANGKLMIRWTEQGGPLVKEPAHQGFGTRVMASIIRDQLQGDVRLDWHPEGLACEVTIQI